MKPLSSMVRSLSLLQLVGRLGGLALLAVAAGTDSWTSSFAQEPQTQPPDSAPDAAGGGVRAHTRLVRRSATAVT